MIAIRTVDLRKDFKKVSELVNSGEKVLIARPRNENLVVISEREYNELEKARHNSEYYNMIDSSLREVEAGSLVTFTLEEVEAMIKMTPEETHSLVAQARSRYKA